MAPLIPVAISLAAKFLPSIIGMFKGDKAEQRAEEVVNIAKVITGQDTPEEIIKILENDAALASQFKDKLIDFQTTIYQEDTKRLESVNQTMRAELANGEKVDNFYQFFLAFWKGGWRPYWGFMSGTAFGVQIFGFMAVIGYSLYKVFNHTGEAKLTLNDVVLIINALATLAGALMATWALALAVLGVAVWKRSDDKKVASGNESPGIFESITGMFKK